MKAAAAAQKNQGDLPPTPLEVQTHLPLRTQDVGRTEYVAPVRERDERERKGEG